MHTIFYLTIEILLIFSLIIFFDQTRNYLQLLKRNSIEKPKQFVKLMLLYKINDGKNMKKHEKNSIPLVLVNC